MEGLPEANSDEILESYPGAEEASDSRFDDVTLRILGYHLIRLLHNHLYGRQWGHLPSPASCHHQ